MTSVAILLLKMKETLLWSKEVESQICLEYTWYTLRTYIQTSTATLRQCHQYYAGQHAGSEYSEHISVSPRALPAVEQVPEEQHAEIGKSSSVHVIVM